MKRVAIIGGGISGLTAAYELEQARKRGAPIDWHLYEASDRLGGIVETTRHTTPEGDWILEGGPDGWVSEKPWARQLAIDLGLEDELLPSNDATRITWILRHGRLQSLPDGMRLYTVPRMQLLNGLRDAALNAGAEIVLSSAVTGAEPEGIIHFADGGHAKADLIVGAEGVASKIRDSLNLAQVNDHTEEGSVRLIVPLQDGDFLPEDDGKYIEQWAGARRFLITPINRHSAYLAFSALDSDPGRLLPLDKASWQRDFPMWSHLIDRVTDDIGHWDVYSVIKLKSWSKGQVTVIGDAAHAQPPNLGQGAGMAMQNALALGYFLNQIESTAEIPAALQNWEASERPIVEHCQKWSVLYGEVIYMPEMLRRRAFNTGFSDPWISAQFFKPALHVPTGSAGFLPA